MFGDPLGILLPFFLMIVPVVLIYFLIRLAVRHGVVDAHRQLRREERSQDYLPNTHGESGNVTPGGTPGPS